MNTSIVKTRVPQRTLELELIAHMIMATDGLRAPLPRDGQWVLLGRIDRVEARDQMALAGGAERSSLEKGALGIEPAHAWLVESMPVSPHFP